MTACDWLDVAAHLGEFVGGSATAVAVYLGFRELRSWREQKRAEKRSESAARALSIIRGTCSRVGNWCLILTMEATSDRGSDEARRQGVEAAVEFGHSDVDAMREALRQAGADTFLYLEPDERKILSDVEGLFLQADLDARAWAKRVGTIEKDALVREFTSLSHTANLLRERAERTLRPIVRFDEAPPAAGERPARSP